MTGWPLVRTVLALVGWLGLAVALVACVVIVAGVAVVLGGMP